MKFTIGSKYQLQVPTQFYNVMLFNLNYCNYNLASWAHVLFFNRTLLVRHYRVYYPVRIHLIQHMVSAMQRLGFTANVSISFPVIMLLCDLFLNLEMDSRT